MIHTVSIVPERQQGGQEREGHRLLTLPWYMMPTGQTPLVHLLCTNVVFSPSPVSGNFPRKFNNSDLWVPINCVQPRNQKTDFHSSSAMEVLYDLGEAQSLSRPWPLKKEGVGEGAETPSLTGLLPPGVLLWLLPSRPPLLLSCPVLAPDGHPPGGPLWLGPLSWDSGQDSQPPAAPDRGT